MRLKKVRQVKKYDIDEILDETTMLPLGYDSKAVVIDNATFLAGKGNKEINEKIKQLHHEADLAEKQTDYNKTAEIKYSQIPALEKQLQKIESKIEESKKS